MSKKIGEKLLEAISVEGVVKRKYHGNRSYRQYRHIVWRKSRSNIWRHYVKMTWRRLTAMSKKKAAKMAGGIG